VSTVTIPVLTSVTSASLGRLEVQVVASIRRDDDVELFVSHVPVLKLYSQGRTEGEALRAIECAVRLYLKTASERGLLDRIRDRPGFRLGDEQFIRVDDGRRGRLQMPAGSAIAAAVPS